MRSPDTGYRPLGLLLLLCGLLYFTRLGGRDLWNPDEPRFALVAREMLLSGDFVVLHRNEKVYSKKPPLLFWSIVLLAKVAGGVSESVARLPSALSATGLVLVTFLFGRSLLGPRAGFRAALILATAALFYWEARFIQTDMLFSLLSATSISCLYHSEQGPRPNWRFSLAGYAAAGLAVLAKGPLALVLLFLVLGPLLAGRHLRNRQFPSLGQFAPHLAGAALAACIALPWYLLSSKALGPEFARQNLLKENIERFFHPFDHRNPFYHYLLALPLDFFPWSLFLPAGLLGLWQQRRGPAGPHAAFLLLWILLPFLFFSSAGSKQGKYLLPIYVPLALAIAWKWEHADPETRPASRPFSILIPLGMADLLLPAAAAVGYAAVKAYHADLLKSLLLPSLTLISGGGIGLVCLLTGRRPAASFHLLWATLAATYVSASLFTVPAINPYKSARPLCEAFLQRAGPDDRAGYLGPDAKSNAYVYYTGRSLEELLDGEEVARFARQPGRAFLFATEDDFDRLPPDVRGIWNSLERRQVGDRVMLLLRSESTPAELQPHAPSR
ncbi:MAG: glycosyltransferase family 39 protein [Planctomycetes bacterium]|nr:glycosyltransferase family 39 protein [Planctomycetota bacterium]